MHSNRFHQFAACLVFFASTGFANAKGAQPFAPGTGPITNNTVPIANPEGAAEPATQQALRETQEALNDPAKRAAMIKGDAKAAIRPTAHIRFLQKLWISSCKNPVATPQKCRKSYKS
jgi:hypothetical protein